MFRTTYVDRLIDRLNQELITKPGTDYYFNFSTIGKSSTNDGVKVEYFENGKLSRRDGPAVEYHDKTKSPEYWIDGRQVTKETVDALIQKADESRIHKIHIDDVPHTVTGKQLKFLKEELKKIK